MCAIIVLRERMREREEWERKQPDTPMGGNSDGKRRKNNTIKVSK
jgi:hypothetical protein